MSRDSPCQSLEVNSGARFQSNVIASEAALTLLIAIMTGSWVSTCLRQNSEIRSRSELFDRDLFTLLLREGKCRIAPPGP